MILFPSDQWPQGSEAWFALRYGRPTASEFSKILTPARGQKSTSQKGYAARLVDERVHSAPEDVKKHFQSSQGKQTPEMERGNFREHESRMEFESRYKLLAKKVGFVCTNDGRFGCSPDALVYEVGGKIPIAGLEVKNYSAADHFAWEELGTLPDDFKCQVHGCMVASELKTWYWMNNCPPYEPVFVKVDWDEFTDKLAAALDEFDQAIFRPLLARVCQNRAIADQVAQFDSEFADKCRRAISS